ASFNPATVRPCDCRRIFGYEAKRSSYFAEAATSCCAKSPRDLASYCRGCPSSRTTRCRTRFRTVRPTRSRAFSMQLRYLLDNDICINAMTIRPPRLLRRLDRFAPVTALSVVVYGELCFGRESSQRWDETAAHLSALLETIQVLPLSLDAGT